MEYGKLRVGFSRVNIDPMLGIAVNGYFVPRFASGILDSIYANAVTIGLDEKLIVMLSIDLCGIKKSVMDEYSRYIAEQNNIDENCIFMHCTHTHTAPYVYPSTQFIHDERPVDKYREYVKMRLADAVQMALADMKPARMGFAIGRAPERVAYIRRYKMKDGSTFTCPPINDPNILHPIGELDQRVNVLRFDREGGDTIVFMNYGLHADTLNLDQISPDWPGKMAETFETAVPGTKVVFFGGAAGDVGSTHVNPDGGDMNDTLISFDNEMKSPGMCRFIGRALAGTILQVYDKVEYVDVDDIDIRRKTVKAAANVPDPEDLPRAHKYAELHDEGRDSEIPFEAMELTTVIAEAQRMLRLENGPEFFELPVTAVKLGPVAMVGFPGEPFTDIGRQTKTAPGWKNIMPCCITNGYEGYFPMKDAFDEGGYEARSSNYKGGVAETLIKGAKELLAEIH